jgi:diguanylate cyclase
MIPASARNFEAAARATLEFLHRRFGFGLWMVTRTRGADWVVLQSVDHGYGVSPGTVFRWADSFCVRMASGEGPRIAPDSDAVPAYAAAPIGSQVPIRAYIGVPLRSADGTLCGIDPQRQPEALLGEQDLIELLASMLSSILSAELALSELDRRSEQLSLQALVDPMTRLSNRRAWSDLLAKEEERCRRYGHAAAVLVVDLDGLKRVNDGSGHAAGDALLLRAADALRGVARVADVVARLGGDEFGVIAVECDAEGAETMLGRVRQAFSRSGVEASVGMATRRHSAGLQAAWGEADERMYSEKHARRPLSGHERGDGSVP